MRYIKQENLNQRSKKILPVIVQVFGKVHECEHHHDQIYCENQLRFVKHIVVQDQEDGECNQHKELGIEKFEDGEVLGCLLAAARLLSDGASTLCIRLLSDECVVHIVQLLLEDVVIGPLLTHKIGYLFNMSNTFIAILRKIILISILYA